MIWDLGLRIDLKFTPHHVTCNPKPGIRNSQPEI